MKKEIYISVREALNGKPYGPKRENALNAVFLNADSAIGMIYNKDLVEKYCPYTDSKTAHRQ